MPTRLRRAATTPAALYTIGVSAATMARLQSFRAGLSIMRKRPVGLADAVAIAIDLCAAQELEDAFTTHAARRYEEYFDKNDALTRDAVERMVAPAKRRRKGPRVSKSRR